MSESVLSYAKHSCRTVSTIPSLIKWSGSKRSQAKLIASEIPPYDRYIEPFLGSGAVLYLAAHPGAIANDVYTPLIDLWKLVRDHPSDVVDVYSAEWERLNSELDRVDISTMSRGNGIPKVFYEIRDRFNQYQGPSDLNFLMRTCVNGIVRFNDKGEFNNSFHLSRRGMEPKRFSSIVSAWHKTIQSVDFRSADYKEILSNAKRGDFVYLDPPYAGTTAQRYSKRLVPDELFRELERLNSRGVLWAMSYDGKRGDLDLTHDVPSSLYERRVYLASGNSAVKKVLGGPIELVEEALYLNF